MVHNFHSFPIVPHMVVKGPTKVKLPDYLGDVSFLNDIAALTKLV
jgi:hypothetical protein